MKAHFEHCQEKIQAGKGFKGEECVEEMSVFSLFLLSATPIPLSLSLFLRIRTHTDPPLQVYVPLPPTLPRFNTDFPSEFS